MADKKVTVIIAGSAGGAVKAFEETAAAAETSAGTMSKKFDEGTTKVGNAFQRLGKSLSSWGLPFGESVSKMGDKLSEAETKGEKFSATMQSVGKVTAAVGLAGFAVVGAESVKMAANFQQSMTLLVTAGGESQSALKMVSDGILKMAGQTGTSTEQLAEGMYTVEKAGYRGADGLNVLKMAAEGAKAENVDLATMTNAVTSVMTSYHVKASDAVSVTNQMVAAAGASKTTMAEFAGALSTVLPVASAAGVSFAQVGGAISTLTQHGTSADEATQELANTIRNLQAPNQVAANEMAQLGLSANDLATHLGSRGLTGTMDMVVTAITKKMGPSGTVLLNSFKENQAASADMQTMLGQMSPKLADLSKKFLDGSLSAKQYKNDIKALGASGYSQGTQFMALADKMSGFNDLLKSGSPAAQTFTDALKKVMGGATGMNTALMLTGENMAGFKARTDEIAAAAKKGGDNVSTWAQTQKNFTVELDEAKQTVEALGIKLGEVLIPKLTEAAKITASVVMWFTQHKTVALALAGVIGGVLAASVAAWTAHMAVAAQRSVVDFGKMIANGAKWVFASRTQMAEDEAVQVASRARAAAGWAAYYAKFLAMQAASLAQWVAGIVSQGAAWVAAQAKQLAESTARGAVWLAEHAAMAGTYIASNVAMAASATAAFVAENAATLGIAAAIAALVAAIVYLATHWHQVWGDIKNWTLDAWHFIDDILHNKFVQGAMAFMAPWLLVLMHWKTLWKGVKTVLDDIWKIIKPILDKISGAVSAIGKGISGISGAASKVGGVVGGVLKHLPHLADGGIVTQPTLALIGEGGEPEYVIPQSKLSQLAPRGATGSLSSGHLGMGASGSAVTYAPTFTIDARGANPADLEKRMRKVIDDSHSELVQMLAARGLA